jgi:membrane-associated phospholipid phosphatase
MSYPSGHVANALVWYGVIALLLGALVAVPSRVHLAIRLVPPVIVFCTTTYLSFHWLTDSVAGLFLGLILTRLMARVAWDAVWLPRLQNGWDRPAGL